MRNPAKLRSVLPLLAAASLVLAGCGGLGSGTAGALVTMGFGLPDEHATAGQPA